MDIPTIKAWPRQDRGTRACRRLRSSGLMPAVLYGRGEANVMLAVQQRDVRRLVDEHNLVLQVDCDGNQTPAQLKEVQYNHLGDVIIHADFDRISLTEVVQVAVPIRTHGEAVGVKEGGVLQLVIAQITVECLPMNIPDHIRVEVAELNIGDGLRVRQLTLPEGVRAVEDPDAMVVACMRPTEIEAEVVEGAEDLQAEPEVIGRVAEPEAAEEGEEEKGAPKREEKAPPKEKE